MDFTACLREQLRLHPAMQPRDVIKMIYQAAQGAEHLLTDTDRARAYFDREYAATPADASLPLLEPLSENVSRANLAAWKATGFPAEWLFRAFVQMAGVPANETDLMAQYIAAAGDVLREEAAFPYADWEAALAQWQAAGMPAVHHSEAYRNVEKPAYRIVSARLGCILPILTRLHEASGIRVIAIDGRAASGKSTRALLLGAMLDAPVIHMDDFFLPPALRTAERLAQPGGNMHHERFAEEVLPGLASGEAFSYRVFDCSRMDFGGVKDIPAAPLRIVEGSYAHHPALGNYAQLKVFTSIDPEEQMHRILRRNGERLAEMFRTRWIPMEEAYFDAFLIREKADMML